MARPKKVVEVEAPVVEEAETVVSGVDIGTEDQSVVFVDEFPNTETELMNDLAARIFEGQSPDLPLNERVRRIRNAIIERGWESLLPLLIIPAKGFERYL
jgi:hypothetical protein